MQHSIIDILQGTPWWVYGIFLYLVRIGIRNLKTRTVPFLQLSILPLFFLMWSLYTLINKYQISGITLTLWTVGIITGVIVGHTLAKQLLVTFDNKKKFITLPGSPMTLIYVLLIFALKYYLGFTYAIHPEAKHQIFFYGIDLCLSGFISGMTLGRFLSFLDRYKKHQLLSPIK